MFLSDKEELHLPEFRAEGALSQTGLSISLGKYIITDAIHILCTLRISRFFYSHKFNLLTDDFMTISNTDFAGIYHLSIPTSEMVKD